VFINKAGYGVRFAPEGMEGKSQPKMIPPKKIDDDSEEDEDDNARDTELEWEKMKRQFEAKEKSSHLEKQSGGSSYKGKTQQLAETQLGNKLNGDTPSLEIIQINIPEHRALTSLPSTGGGGIGLSRLNAADGRPPLTAKSDRVP